MNRIARLLTIAAFLAVALVAANKATAYDEKETAAAIKDVVALAKDAEEGKVDEAKAKAIKKKFEDLNTVMHIYKPREKGGLGVGPKAKGDGIEIKLNNLGKRALSAMQATKEKDDLIMVGKVNVAMAEVTKLYAPTKPKGGKGAKEWNGFSDEMKKASLELIAAAKKGEPDAIKKAANNLNNSCNSCHSDFRDN